MELYMNFMMANKDSSQGKIFYVLIGKSLNCLTKCAIIQCKKDIRDKVNLSSSILLNPKADDKQWVIKKFRLNNYNLHLEGEAVINVKDFEMNNIRRISLTKTPNRKLSLGHNQIDKIEKTVFINECFHNFEYRKEVVGNLFITLGGKKYNVCVPHVLKKLTNNMFYHSNKKMIMERKHVVKPTNILFEGLGITENNLVAIYVNRLRKLKSTTSYIKDTMFDEELVNGDLSKEPEKLAISKFKKGKRDVKLERYSNTINSPCDSLLLTFPNNNITILKGFSKVLLKDYLPISIQKIFKNGNGFVCNLGLQDHRRLVTPYDGQLVLVKRVDGDLVLVFRNDTHMYPDFIESDFRSIYYGHRVGSGREDPDYIKPQPNNTLYWAMILSSNFDKVSVYDNAQLNKIVDFKKDYLQQISKKNWFKRGDDFGGVSLGVSNIFIITNRFINFRNNVKLCKQLPVYLQANEIFGDIN